MSDPVTPAGMRLTVTDANKVVVNFDHGDIPEVLLDANSAEAVGSQIVSAANRARKPKSDQHAWGKDE